MSGDDEADETGEHADHSDAQAGVDKPAGDLKGDVPLDQSLVNKLGFIRARKLKKAQTPASRLRDAMAARADQENVWRGIVFVGVLVMIAVSFGIGAIIMLVYFFSSPSGASPTVLAAWFGASVVQTIGLLAIITRSLFPTPPPEVDEGA